MARGINIRASGMKRWSRSMNIDERRTDTGYGEIEPGVLILAAAYAAAIIGMILLLSA